MEGPTVNPRSQTAHKVKPPTKLNRTSGKTSRFFYVKPHPFKFNRTSKHFRSFRYVWDMECSEVVKWKNFEQIGHFDIDDIKDQELKDRRCLSD